MHVTMTTFLDEITRTLNFLPVFFLSFFSLIVECMQDERERERENDSSVGWLNYNKSGRAYTAKCRCMEKKKRRRKGELLIMLLRRTTPGEEKKRTR